MKYGVFALLISCSMLASISASAAEPATLITCFANANQKFFEITQAAGSAKGRYLLNTLMGDGSPVHSSFRVLRILPGEDALEYDIHMVEHLMLGELSEDPNVDRADPQTNDMRAELKLDLRHPESSEMHIVTHETFKAWRMPVERSVSESTFKIRCEVARFN